MDDRRSKRRPRSATGSRCRSTWRPRRRARDGADRRALVRRREGRARALRRGRSRRRSPPSVTSASRVLRPEAARHPDHGRRGRAALARLGVRFMNFHAAGGIDMLRAFVDGAREGESGAGLAPPLTLAVTVLTSDADASPFDARLRCAGSGLRRCGVQRDGAGPCARRPGSAHGPGRAPGRRGDRRSGARRPARDAIARGADWIVVGRPVSAPTIPPRLRPRSPQRSAPRWADRNGPDARSGLRPARNS